MDTENAAGLFWPAFFVSKKDKNTINQLKAELTGVTAEQYSREDCEWLRSGTPWDAPGTLYASDRENGDFVTACEKAILDFCTESTTFARDTLPEEEYRKAGELCRRKQYESKTLRSLLAKFFRLLKSGGSADARVRRFQDLFLLSIDRTVRALREERADRAFGPLKKQIGKVASGVRAECYALAEGLSDSYEWTLSDGLNAYSADRFSYDFNRAMSPRHDSLFMKPGRQESLNAALQRLLLDDAAFWKEHPSFSVAGFLRHTEELNGETHARKILAHIYENATASETGARLLKANLPLDYIDGEALRAGMEQRTFRMALARFEGKYDLSKARGMQFCYPYSKTAGAGGLIAHGETIISDLFRAVYPDGSETAIGFVRSELENPSPVMEGKPWTLRDVFDSFTFGYWKDCDDRAVANLFCPGYSDAENIWDRCCIMACAVESFSTGREDCLRNLFEIYYDVFQSIGERLGLKTSYQRDAAGREERYRILKDTLKENGVGISDSRQSDYTVSLLDRKVAVAAEMERFPVLEQMGDAVYGMAVAEMLFYDPGSDREGMAREIESRIRASSQVKVAKKMGLDRLYLSATSMQRKYADDVLINPSFPQDYSATGDAGEEKYLADSLEMVLGAVCLDCGQDTAVTLAKKLIRDAYPGEFGRERRDILTELSGETGEDYWNQILPAPFSEKDRCQDAVWKAARRLAAACILGTEDRKARQTITYIFDDRIFGCRDILTISLPCYVYMHEGIGEVISRFRETVTENFRKTEKN